MNIQEVYQKILSDLRIAEIPNPENETREILCFVLKKDWAFLLSHPEKKLAEKQIKEINQLIQRRLKNEPLAYILGYKNFYGLDFIVNKDVLIPRPETEMVVDKISDLLLNLLSNKFSNKLFYIDIGTGSGCIPISIIKKVSEKHKETSLFPEGGLRGVSKSFKLTMNCFATDISSEALRVAKKNAEKHQASNQIKFIQGNLISPFLKGKLRGFLRIPPHHKLQATSYKLIITANLPYLSEKLYQSTPKSVKNYEPEKALVAGKDGLDYYRKLLDQIKTIKSENPKTKITAFFEISPEQKNLIKKEILKKFPNEKINFHKDLAQKWRIAEIAINY